MLGGGGAARAVIYALLERGIAHVVVANRTEGRAEALRERFGARVHAARWDDRNAALADAALVVNTTTLGMPGQPELALDIGRLPGHAIVADLVYWPLDHAADPVGAGAGIAHRRRAWHADASGRRRLCAMVRQKAGSDRGIAGAA